MRFIGITGGIGAGKSEILKYIKKHYLCEIYLADEVAHEVKRKGTKCQEQLVSLLGEDILQADGEIDKSIMARKIFASEGILEQVNALIHPAVREYLLEKYREAKEAGQIELFFVEAALLIECGYGNLVDEMWYVYADDGTRRRRLKESRGYSDEKIEQIMQAQLSDEAFRRGSDFILDNSTTLSETYRQIDQKLEAYTWQE